MLVAASFMSIAFAHTPQMATEEHEEWMELYRAALLELDSGKFRQRLAEAETAIQQRLQQLSRDG